MKQLKEYIELADEKLSEEFGNNPGTFKKSDFISRLQQYIETQSQFDYVTCGNKDLYEASGNKKYEVEMSRVMKIKFRCNSGCKRGGKNKKDANKERTWTSYFGLVAFKFYFVSSRDYVSQNKFKKMKTKLCLMYQFKIYSEECKSCGNWATGYMYQDTGPTIAKLLTSVINLVLLMYPNPRKNIKLTQEILKGKSLNTKKSNNRGRHLKALCEACHAGKCRHSKKSSKKK